MKFTVLAICCVVVVRGAHVSVLTPEGTPAIAAQAPVPSPDVAEIQVGILEKVGEFIQNLIDAINEKANPEKPAPAPHQNVRKIEGPTSDEGLNICTWNVFRFGPKKFEAAVEKAWAGKYKQRKIDMLVDQIKEADIMAIQEFFDPSEKVMDQLVDELNAKTGQKYEHKCGPRVGRVSKEQYCFVYKSDIASITKDGTYPEPAGTDPFSREPFYAKFKVNKKSSKMTDFVLGTIHTEPAKAAQETSSLIEAMAWAEKEFGTSDVMTLGDYNADCQYIAKSAWSTVRLKNDVEYQWFIEDGTDTASMKSKCTFDRAVSKSKKFKGSFVKGSTRVLDFVNKFGIAVAEARQLSDHFPVCMTFK